MIGAATGNSDANETYALSRTLVMGNLLLPGGPSLPELFDAPEIRMGMADLVGENRLHFNETSNVFDNQWNSSKVVKWPVDCTT